jgi:hypothetical protein
VSSRDIGLLVIGGGVALIVVGVLIWLGWMSWFGRLPGDISYESDNTRIYAPIVSMLIVSIVLSLIFALIRRFF